MLNTKAAVMIALILVFVSAPRVYSPASHGPAAPQGRTPPDKDPARVDGRDRTPPGITKGVRVQFSAQTTPFSPAQQERGYLVEDVRGNWVRMKGEPWPGFTEKVNELSAWINFDRVDWYRVKP